MSNTATCSQRGTQKVRGFPWANQGARFLVVDFPGRPSRNTKAQKLENKLVGIHWLSTGRTGCRANGSSCTFLFHSLARSFSSKFKICAKPWEEWVASQKNRWAKILGICPRRRGAKSFASTPARAAAAVSRQSMASNSPVASLAKA